MIATAIPDKSHPDRIAERKHKAKDQSQAIALQSAICDTCLRFKQAFDQSQDLPLQHGIAETMTKLASTWRAISEHRREILGKPRAGSLSPAERAAMRQRKSQRSQSRAPTLAKPVVASKESLSAP